MSAYVVADVEVTDPVGFEEYRLAVAATIEKYGGTYLARGGNVDVREGDWAPKRIVVLQFPDVATAKRWYESDDYAPLIALRQRSANTRVLIVEGV